MNDLSLCGQFRDLESFRDSVGLVMAIRQEVQRRGSSLYCHRKLAYAQVTDELAMQQAIQGLPTPQRLALIQWLTSHGPYWEDMRFHRPEDWLEVNGQIVTDSAVAEAAVCRLRGLLRELVSFAPSTWTVNPVEVTLVHDEAPAERVSVPNHWEISSVKKCLDANPERIISWAALDAQMRRVCTRLTFGGNAFGYLDGHPFAPGAAERIRVLLHTLNEFKGCFDAHGQRTAAGHRLYSEHFTGDKAWFSDSSDAEKAEFEKEMRFPYPEDPTQDLFCTWHGKVKTQQIRIHFSWPIRSDVPLYIMYVGPKITKR